MAGGCCLGGADEPALITAEPRAGTYLHPYIGSEEFINGGSRWILALHNATPSDIRAMKARGQKISMLYVTTPENAARLRAEAERDRPTPPALPKGRK